MRRSSAPSQVSSVKRQKFCPPFLSKNSGSDICEQVKVSANGANLSKDNRFIDDSNNILKCINKPELLISSSKDLSDLENAGDNHIKKPFNLGPVPKYSANKDCDKALGEFVDCSYYNVVWCKQSTRKHKRWEGDGILIVKRKSVVLQDLEGKQISCGSGYKSTDLKSLEEGSNLKIGAKEVEISSIIDPDFFRSGKCYQTSTEQSNPQSTYAAKPFIAPSINPMPATKLLSGKVSQSNHPRHPVDSPNALVMPRPSATHQWLSNKHQLPIVDVVIDPHLANKLRPHQREGIIFLYECIMGFRNDSHLGAILADDMGLGKTLQCVSLVWTLLKQGPYGGQPVMKKVVIVTPSSLVKNWMQEFKQWLGTERLSVFCVSQGNKVEDFLKSSLHSVLIISYEMFLRASKTLETIKFGLIICDEGHRLKNTNIKTTSVISNTSIRRRIVLTGTPIQNDLQEFFSIVEFCNPGILGSSSTFKRIYEGPIFRSNQPDATKEQKMLGEARAGHLNRLISHFTLRRTADVINKFLPPKVEMVVICKLFKLQIELYKKLISSNLLKSCISGTRENGMTHLIGISALRKLCNHPSLLYQRTVDAENEALDFSMEDSLFRGLFSSFPPSLDAQDLVEAHSGKMKVVSQILHQLHQQEDSEKIVLVSSYTQTLDLLQQLCEKHGYSTLRLDGSTPSGQRQKLVDTFNSKYDHHSVFLLSSKAGGVGLNLIGASRILLYDIDWNPATDLQAMARIWRDGQKRKVYIYRLLSAGTIEEKMYQRQIMKQGISGSVVDLKESSNSQFTLSDLKDLFSYQENSNCSTHDLLDCSCLCSENKEVSPGKVEPDSVRPCQLVVPSVHELSKKLSMAELMQWKHIQGPINEEDIQDPILAAAGKDITFVFKN